MNEPTSQEPIGQDRVESAINSICEMVCDRSLLPKDRKPDLLTICSAILLAEGMNKLSAISVDERAVLRSYLQTYQNPDNGFFSDPFTASAKPANESWTKTYPLFQTTTLVLQALNALGEKALYCLNFTDALNSQAAMTDWLEEVPWTCPLAQSNRVVFLLNILIYKVEVEKEPSSARLFHWVLDWLNQTQDSITGMWGMPSKVFHPEAIIATSRLVPFFEYVHRPIMRVMGIVDTILDHQQADGSLSDSLRNNSAGRVAVAHLLATFARDFDYRSDEIKQTLMQIYHVIQAEGEAASCPFPTALANQQQDTEIITTQSPLWSTWNDILTTAIIKSRYPDEIAQANPGTFRRWPALGYHKPEKNLTDYEREVLPLWIRRISTITDKMQSDEEPSISIIIPCYNLGKYIYEAVESVFDQTMQQFEIIIVNDGSTDELTKLMLEAFEHPQIRVVHQENQGVGAARNHGIRLAKGRYICCLDADDRIRPTFLAQAYTILDTQAEVGFVTGYFKMFDEATDIFRPDNCDLLSMLILNYAVEPSVFRKEGWGKVGGYCETFSSGGIEDWDLWLSLLELGYRASIIPEIVWDYRIRANQMSAKMYEPETWGQLMKELAIRHQKTYSQNLVAAIAKQGTYNRELLKWIENRQKAILWWQRQASSWQEQSSSWRENASQWKEIAENTRLKLEKVQSESNLKAVLKKTFLKFWRR
jgi:glycosyltransferase involved in cell wall biosynthesis